MKFTSFVCLAVSLFGASILAAGEDASKTQLQYLSGKGALDQVLWDFQVSGGRNAGTWGKIHVPACWELEGYGVYNYGMPLRDKLPDDPAIAREQGHYKHRFSVPADWKGRQLRLVFEGVMTDAEVRVNGQLAGPVHQGAYYAFKFDVSSLVKFDGENELEVVVSKESANHSVNEAERRGDYWNFGGIFRPVYLESLPLHHIEQISVDAKADGQLLVQTELTGETKSGEYIEAQVFDREGHAQGGSFRLDVSQMDRSGRLKLQAKIAGVKPWTAETPQLYRLVVQLKSANAVLHTVEERIGFRTFEIRQGDGLYLNGTRIILKGANRHCFWPETGRAMNAALDLADVKLMKEMNMNVVRCSHYPPDKSFLDYCDELGLYVLDELGGWHGQYDTKVGRSLLEAMVRHDVNHPSILFWDNGNEGGWNVELDGDFRLWDPQERPVLHPLGVFSGMNTFHYRSYDETKHYLDQPEIFMPTEFLHGLFDGGHGAGLHDYWELMSKSPRCAGGILWVYADEGVVRSDQDGRVDNAGNFAPDGIVGPHHEKEGSYYTVREVWSPIQLRALGTVAKGFDGRFSVENHYDFTNLDSCTLEWSLASFPAAEGASVGHKEIAHGSQRAPKLAPHETGICQLTLPANWTEADVLYVGARGPSGELLWTWSWSWKSGLELTHVAAQASKVLPRDDSIYLSASVGAIDLRLDKSTGDLDSVYVHGVPVHLNKGPRFVASHRADRSLDGVLSTGLPKGEDRKYLEIVDAHKLVSLTQRQEGETVVFEAVYDGMLKRATWRIQPDATVRLDYEYAFEGVVDLMGVGFNSPEKYMRSVRWLGAGPARSWQNRLNGTTLDLYTSRYSDFTPGEGFDYPEFKGFFQGWKWAEFTSDEVRMLFVNDTPGTFLGVYAPKDGKGDLLYTFPQMGLTILDVIPPVRNKVNATELIGPQSQPYKASGLHKGSLLLRFDSAK